MRMTRRHITRCIASVLWMTGAAGVLAWTTTARADAASATNLGTPPAASVLARYDLDRDGVLGPDEKSAYRRDLAEKVEPMRKAALREFDWNRNGKLDADEQRARQSARQAQHARAEARALAKYDADGDGTLDPEEQARRRSDREAWLLRKKAQILEHNDSNRNGVVDVDEKAAMRKRLDAGRSAALERWDANRDGRLDDVERTVAMRDEKAGGPSAGTGDAAARDEGAKRSGEEGPAAVEGAATLGEVRVAPLAGARRTQGAEIGFSLGRSGRVSVRVYDAAGRVVRSLVSSEGMSAGPHKVRWDGSGAGGDQVANGLYVISVEAFGQRVARKVPIVR